MCGDERAGVAAGRCVALAERAGEMRAAVDAVSTVNAPIVRDATDKSGDAVDALAVAAFTR